MVEIKYCPQCQKAKREHLYKTSICQFCGSEMVSIEAGRTRYFYFMLPFLLLGAIFHLYAVYRLSVANKGDPSVTLGLVLLGIGMYIIAIGFQVLDSKQMENEALVIGASRNKRSGNAPSSVGSGPEPRPKASGSALRVRGPKRPSGKAYVEPDMPARDGSEHPGHEGPEEPRDERSEIPKKEIPIRRPKEKGPAQEVAEKKADDIATDGRAKTKKGKPPGAKVAKAGKALKPSPPKARKILTK